MAYFIKIETKEDLDHLKRYIDSWVVKCKENISAYVEYLEMFERLQKAFEQPLVAEEVEVAREVAAPARKPRQPVLKSNLCKEHPTYKAVRAPRTDCGECWAAFGKLAGRPRAKQARDKFDRQRKKLNESNS